MTFAASSYWAFSASMSAWRLSSLTAIFHQSWRSAPSSVASSSVEPFLMPFGAAVATCFEQHLLEAREGGAVEDRAFVVGVLLEPLLLLGLDRARTVIDVDAVAVEDADLDHRAADARRQAERGVANVRSLFAEDGAEELLLRSHRAFALRRDLADQDVARLDLGADVDDARLVEVAKRFLADVRDVAGDVLRPELGVAGHDLELLDVDRGEDVVLHDPLGDQDRSPRNCTRSTA